CNIAKFNHGKVYFYGVVGNDDNGKFLTNFASQRISHLYLDTLNECETTQAIVSLDNGERSFRFVRGADYHLNIHTLKKIDFNDIKIVHLGSLMLSHQEGRNFIDESIKYIRSVSKAKISFDVNYRDDIFSSPEEAKNAFMNVIRQVDIIKFTEEELTLLSGQDDIKLGLTQLLNSKQIAVVTLGKDGSVFYSKDIFVQVPTYPLKPVDTTGAGDAFYSYFLYRLDLGFDIKDIKDVLLRSNVVGGLTTQKKGAIETAPTLEEIEIFIKEHH
ncbi:MAG: hypothetical protein J5666_04495, partial [Bacilli bacterium]|nr:hypothetical protein [Bacilli bacterium]